MALKNVKLQNAADIWREFRDKLKRDTLTASDFTAEMRVYLQPLLCGEHAAQRRRKYLDSPYDIYEGVDKISVVSHCADDDYRFDFLSDRISWQLAFIECITLPVSDMNVFPYSGFRPLDKKELQIRREKEISQLVHFYLKFRELAGREKALACFYDGQGEFLCARSWVPFYRDRLAYIAYCAWYECRINGENVEVKEFQEGRCEVVIHHHIWRNMYFIATHLGPLIDYSEYMELYEAIWRNRAACAGWNIEFVYTEEDTALIFNR